MRIPVVVLCLSLATAAIADAPPAPADAYDAGYELGKSLGTAAGQGPRVDIDAVYRGVVDGVEAARTGVEGRKKLQGRHGVYTDDFAVLNSQRPGVVTLDSGVQYEVLRAGDGRVPGPDDTVRLHYEGSLSDGYVFDSTTADEPAVIRVSDIVVPGFREALLRMPAGSHWRVVVPVSQGFARAGNNKLRRRDLVYDLQLLEVLR